MSRPGVTLIELVVVIMIIGLIATVTGLAFRDGATEPVPETRAQISRARREAIRRRTPVVVIVADTLGVRAISAMPDGSIIGASGLDSARFIERLSGRPARSVRNADR